MIERYYKSISGSLKLYSQHPRRRAFFSFTIVFHYFYNSAITKCSNKECPVRKIFFALRCIFEKGIKMNNQELNIHELREMDIKEQAEKSKKTTIIDNEMADLYNDLGCPDEFGDIYLCDGMYLRPDGSIYER